MTPSSEKKVAFPLLILLATLLVVGAGYYYLGIYQQIRYANVAIQVYEEIRESSQMLKPLELVNSEDYEGALKSLHKYQQFFAEGRNKLKQAKAPFINPGRQVDQELLAVIKIYDESIDKAQKSAEFMQKTVELREALEFHELETNNQGNISMQDAQDVYTRQVSKVKQMGNDLFGREPPELNKVSFLELETAWQKAKVGLDNLLKFIMDQDLDYHVGKSLKYPLTRAEAE